MLRRWSAWAGREPKNRLDDGSTSTPFHISVKANGIEETSITDLAVPPSGPKLLSGVGDIRGFYHSSVTTVPSTQYQVLTSTSSLDFAQNVPAKVAFGVVPSEYVIDVRRSRLS